MADGEKQQLPSMIVQPPMYSQAEPKSTHKSTVVLSAYAAAVTALLLAALIFGGSMYHKQSQSCSDKKADTSEVARTETKTNQFNDENGDKVTEKVELDYTKEIEVIRLSKNSGRTDNGIVVIDYKRSLTGMYLPEDDQCYLIGGVDHNLKSPFGENYEDVAQDDDEKDEMFLRVADGYPILDDSVLPEYLRPYCSGKKIQWLERTTQGEMDQSRTKRGLCVRYRCVLAYENGRWRYRCYTWITQC